MTLVRGTFQDKSFSALFQLLLTKDPYKEDFKVYIKMFYLSGLNTKKCSKAYNAQEELVPVYADLDSLDFE